MILKSSFMTCLLVSLLASVAFNSASFASPGDYDNSVLTLGVNAYAKELCSCIFVAQQSEESCLAFSRIPELPALLTSVKINRSRQYVRVRSVLFWKGVAHFVNERSGCQLN